MLPDATERIPAAKGDPGIKSLPEPDERVDFPGSTITVEWMIASREVEQRSMLNAAVIDNHAGAILPDPLLQVLRE